MTPKEYQEAVLQVESTIYNAPNERLLHGVLGCVTESGELADVLKKQCFYGTIQDKWALIEEMGDLFWYLEILCDELEVTFEEVWDMNIAKLRKRYPGKFTQENAENRDYDAEREAAEGMKRMGFQPETKEPICYAKKGIFGLDFGMFVLCKSSVIDKDLPCPYYKACNKKHELLSEIDPPTNQQDTDLPECFGTASKDNQSDQKCLGCLSRGPCVRKTIQNLPTCFGTYDSSISDTTVCGVTDDCAFFGQCLQATESEGLKQDEEKCECHFEGEVKQDEFHPSCFGGDVCGIACMICPIKKECEDVADKNRL